ncbi:MAG: argininosuccinate synthase [Methanoregulaceae archaeon]|nr:argininosuccinate synthase [Methanoregulaceae archaeon]
MPHSLFCTLPPGLQRNRRCLFTLLLLAGILFSVQAVAATTTLHIEKLGSDGKTALSSRDVNVTWMEGNLPVQGDGVTHYYHQGPVFSDNPDPVIEEALRWNPAEDTNIREKDMGAVKGTALRDLCDLVGGMEPGDTVTLIAADGFKKTFAYQNVYQPPERQGTMVITWYRADEGYVPDYATGMRLVFFADTSQNPWGLHAFGNEDWKLSADPAYYYYYVQGGERYPTTTGLSVQQVENITIHQTSGTSGPAADPTPSLPLSLLVTVTGLLIGGLIASSRGDNR